MPKAKRNAAPVRRQPAAKTKSTKAAKSTKATQSTKAAKFTKSAAAKPATTVTQIAPCLWFADQGEEAARYYVSIFRKGRIKQVTRYPAVGQEIHGRPPGSVMTVEFELLGTSFTALNGGPVFTFNEAISLQILCATQKEVDYYWEKLGEGGDVNAQQCGWLKDKYGLSWQVVPEGMGRMMKKPDSPAAQRVFGAMLKMKKLDIAELEAAYRG